MYSSIIAGPDPNSIYPLPDYKSLVFLKNIIKASNIIVGNYTYFDDRRSDPLDFEENNVLYNYDFTKVKSQRSHHFYFVAHMARKRF